MLIWPWVVASCPPIPFHVNPTYWDKIYHCLVVPPINKWNCNELLKSTDCKSEWTSRSAQKILLSEWLTYCYRRIYHLDKIGLECLWVMYTGFDRIGNDQELYLYLPVLYLYLDHCYLSFPDFLNIHSFFF